MERKALGDKLCLSGIDGQAAGIAREMGLGFEVTAFCQASLLADGPTLAAAEKDAAGQNRLWLHAPFAELHPGAIDPLVRKTARRRYRETMAVARHLGIRHIVIHDGYVPMVYFPEWFIDQSVLFWQDFLREVPADMTLALENVMDEDPRLLRAVLEAVDDPRLVCCWDVGHANTRVSALPPGEWIAPLAPWLRHVHIHNNDGDWDLHAPLGQGSIPMEHVLDTLLEQCPAADFTIENMNCRPSLDWLREKGYL